jgi:hypothetical protein
MPNRSPLKSKSQDPLIPSGEVGGSDSASSPVNADTPGWVTETPMQTFGYWLSMEEESLSGEVIELTRAEYIELKQHLAKMRGYMKAAGE